MMHYTHNLSQARIHQIVGWFVLVPVLVLVSVLVVVRQNENLFEKKYHVTTVFSEGFGLKVGYPVILLGLEVGRVGKIEFTEQNNTRFTLTILQKYQEKIRANSVAKIGKSGGLLGDPQIEITPGNKNLPVIADGGHIESDEPFDLMATVRTMLDSTGKTLVKVDGVVEEVQATVKTGHAALVHVEEASAGLPEVMGNIKETTATIKETSTTIKNASQNIAKEVPALAASARKSLNRVGDVMEDVKASTEKLPPILENLKATTEDVRGLTHNDVPPLVHSVQGTMDDVNEILVGAKKTFPISIFAAKGRAERVEDNAAGATSGLRSLRADEPTKE